MPKVKYYVTINFRSHREALVGITEASKSQKTRKPQKGRKPRWVPPLRVPEIALEDGPIKNLTGSDGQRRAVTGSDGQQQTW